MEQISREKLQELDHLFRKAVRKFVKERDKISIEGISLPGLMILRKIINSGEQRLSDLAEEMDLTSGAITAQCDKLEEQGLAERVRYKEDRRAIYLRITDQGQAFIEQHHHVGYIHADVLFHGFAAQELEQQLHFYKRLIENLQGMSEKILAANKLEAPAVSEAVQFGEQVQQETEQVQWQQVEQVQQQTEQVHLQQAERALRQQAEQAQQAKRQQGGSLLSY